MSSSCWFLICCSTESSLFSMLADVDSISFLIARNYILGLCWCLMGKVVDWFLNPLSAPFWLITTKILLNQLPFVEIVSANMFFCLLTLGLSRYSWISSVNSFKVFFSWNMCPYATMFRYGKNVHGKNVHGLIAQLVRASEWNSVVAGSNTSQANFL